MHYQRVSEGDHIGHRGLGMYKNWLYFTTPDAHLVCLDARDGTVRWIVELADPKLGYFSTMAPLVVRDHVIAGVSGDVTDVRGFLESLDPETGRLQWRWYTDPDPGQPGSETWPKDTDAIIHGGGMTWMSGTYDPELNLLYWGTGNPNPVLAGATRPGDNLYTCLIARMASTSSPLRSSTRRGHQAWIRAAAPSLSRKLLRLRTERSWNPLRTVAAIGWRRVSIPKPVCFM